ncbi:MAG: ZIP family metal transporter [Chloroflexota bacterium]
MLLLEPFLLSLLAGLATGVGGLIVLFLRKISDRIVSLLLGFASGVMLMVAFNSLFLEAQKLLVHVELITFFVIGAVSMMALDLAIPHIEPTRREENGQTKRMHRSGMLIAVGITLHNLPEGFVVAAGYLFNPALGIIIAIAIILHNIPEGIATAIPLSEAGTKPLKTTIVTFLSGLAEPVGAVIGAVLLSSFAPRIVIGYSLVFAAGVMTYITADELIPVAHEYGFKHTVSVGLLLGIIFALLIDVILS